MYNIDEHTLYIQWQSSRGSEHQRTDAVSVATPRHAAVGAGAGSGAGHLCGRCV